MDIKNKLFKFKRAVHKNRELIAKSVSITLTAILVIAVAVGAYKIYQSDLAYEAEMNKVVDDGEKITIAPGWDYGEPGFNKVAENAALILEADYTTGEIRVTEKNTGKQWYSNPADRDSDPKKVDAKALLKSQFIVDFYKEDGTPVTDKDNYTDSIKKGGMSYQLVENGIKFTFAFPTANVYIPIQYTLCDDGFQAEIVTSEIKSVGNKAFLVESIELLPYFGAAGVTDEGYLFVPDGSGALLNYNVSRGAKTQKYVAQVYGANPTLGQATADTVKERVSIPVFGAKTNDSAFIGVILSGDSNSTITAITSGMGTSYNRVYPTAAIYDCNKIVAQADAVWGASKSTTILIHSDNLTMDKNYAVRYMFLNGEDASYVGMAERYREFLNETKALKESKLAEDKYLVLDLVGAVSIDKYVFGVKQPVVTAMTTYNDVVTIVKELKEKGVDKLIINYIGALDSGLNNEIYSYIKTESALGTKKEFQAMIEYLAEQKVQLFLESNPVDLYNSGHGYDNNGDSAKSFYDKYAFQHNYELDSLKPTSDRWHLLHPAKVPGLVSKYAKSATEWNISYVSLARIGETLYSDYADDVPSTTRAHALELWKQAMQSVVDNGEQLMVHGGNAYTLAYADVITDTSTGSSDFDVEDKTIPFYQIAFQGNTVLTPGPLNNTVDYTREFLKCLETGCSLKYNLFYGDVANVVGTAYNSMVSYSYEYWKDIIVEQYLAMQKASAQFAGKEIVAHQELAEDVTLTEYENGKIIINYSSEDYTYEGNVIKSRDYLVMGGAK